MGGVVLKYFDNILVNVKWLDYEIRVEVRLDVIYMYEEVVVGVGGLLVGIGGKMLLMFLGGIDLLVVGMEVMRWGVIIEVIYFYSLLFISD